MEEYGTRPGPFQATPIVVRNVLYFSTMYTRVASLDAVSIDLQSGPPIWRARLTHLSGTAEVVLVANRGTRAASCSVLRYAKRSRVGGWAAQVAPGLRRDEHTPVSRYELLELLASRRFEDPNWFVRLQGMSQENLLRELVTLQAVSLMLDWQRYRTDERRGAIGAASLALGVEEMRRLPGLANPPAGAN